MADLQDLGVPVEQMDAARQAGVEAPHRAHDVDPLERVLPVLLEERACS
jgi:hypothetical protein